MIQAKYSVQKGDYLRAGEASADIKRVLKRLGIEGTVLRRISVAAYEVEMNLVIHSMGGNMEMFIKDDTIWIVSKDEGPGIKDIEKAMTAGYSTADSVAQGMGFGAGMGLPNMKRNADKFTIDSTPGLGTEITMGFSIKGNCDG
ncbi:MAG: ATP-binding protein [Eubacteriales bacterium]|nr:ATP-binding protein [Eubacteriales bacterium]